VQGHNGREGVTGEHVKAARPVGGGATGLVSGLFYPRLLRVPTSVCVVVARDRTAAGERDSRDDCRQRHCCDAVLRDPADPEQLRPEFDSGDHIHTNAAGYAAMADAVDVSGL
jgi:hypothetical protein